MTLSSIETKKIRSKDYASITEPIASKSWAFVDIKINLVKILV